MGKYHLSIFSWVLFLFAPLVLNLDLYGGIFSVWKAYISICCSSCQGMICNWAFDLKHHYLYLCAFLIFLKDIDLLSFIGSCIQLIYETYYYKFSFSGWRPIQTTTAFTINGCYIFYSANKREVMSFYISFVFVFLIHKKKHSCSLPRFGI